MSGIFSFDPIFTIKVSHTNQYFALFQLPEQFNIDDKQLEQNYRLLAAQCHPDKFAARSAFEQKQAMMMAATVNEAYRIQQMQWRETLEDARTEADWTTLKELAATIELEQTGLYQQLDAAFIQNQPEKAAELVRQGRFLHRLQSEIQAALP